MGLGPAPLAWPIGAKAPRDTVLKVAICHAEISASYGVSLYPIYGGAARVGWLGQLLWNNCLLLLNIWAYKV
jgi:hypothetical protein